MSEVCSCLLRDDGWKWRRNTLRLSYSPYTSPLNTTDVVIENIRTLGNSIASAADGILLRRMIGGTVRNCYILGHLHGITLAEQATSVLVTKNEVPGNYLDGIFIGATTVPEEITCEYNWCWSNGAGPTAAGIYAQAGLRHNIRHNRLGTSGDSFQSYGVHVNAACGDVEVSRNHVAGVISIGYFMGSSTAYGCVRLFEGNTTNATYVPTAYSGLNILPVRLDLGTNGVAMRKFRAQRVSLSASTTPTGGSWLVGDDIEYGDPQAGDYRGTLCVSAGSPGTWKRYGQATA
ncbi:right-handed parallel beta-helix repeat-containing protein [Bradyrhizobium sp. 197]|uniref:right-handed parallel beta-helix repeat-containing protein n=1 Tax=Bradyrhizobium sp. 197 TaxID=2782663 RepID=UPI001FF86F7D|nr:right-handed parallel beta-helix repeat-containing protein [Bradyrhizobium sp. 197]MCK1477698.1 right-handed parallel beta-helix repeat-containing protein [Bradyrhizobium sp. 197]